MSNIELGTLEYGFLLNLTDFQSEAQRLYRELGRMDETVQVRLDKIGLRADQAGKTVQKVARDIATSNRMAQLSIDQATTSLRAQSQVHQTLVERSRTQYERWQIAVTNQQRIMERGYARLQASATQSAQAQASIMRDVANANRAAATTVVEANNRWRNSLATIPIAQRKVQESTEKLAQVTTQAANTQLANNDRLSRSLRDQYEHKLQYDRLEEASEDRKLRNFETKQREYVAAAERRANAMRNISQQAIVGGAIGGAALFAAGRQAAAFQQQQQRLVGQFGETPQSAERIGNQVRSIGRTRGTDPTETMAGFIQLRAMGRSTSDAMKELDSASTAAFGHMAQVGDIVKTVNQTMQSYDVAASRAADVTDILSKEVTDTGATWKILGSQMSQSETQAKSMGISLQELAATFVTAKQAGVPIESMGSQWTGAMSRLVAARKQTRDAAHEMGLAWIEHGQVVEHIAKVGYPAAMAEIAKATHGSAARIMELFGGRGMVDRTIIATIQNIGKLQQNVIAMHHAQGAAAKAAAAADDTLNGQLRRLNTNLHDFQITMGKEMLPSLTQFLQHINGLFNAFNRLSEGAKHFIAMLGVGGVAGLAGVGLAGAIGLCVVQIAKLRAAMLTLGASGGVMGALTAVKNVWSGAAAGANMATMIAGGGIGGAIAMTAAAAVTFGAAYWVGSYIAKIGGIADAWKRVKEQQTKVLAAGGGVPELLQAATYVRRVREHPLEAAQVPSAGGWDVLQQQLHLRHLTTLDQATAGQKSGIEQDLRNLARGIAIRRGPAVHPHAAAAAAAAGGTAPIQGKFSTAGSVMAGRGARAGPARTVAEKIARAAEAMLGQPGGSLSSQELVNAALRRAGITEHALTTGAGQADLARITQRTTAPRRGDVGYSGQQAFVVRGRNPDGSLNVVFDPAGGGQDIHTYHIPQGVQSAYQFYRPGVFSGQENQAQVAAQRRAAAAARQAAALQRRQRDMAFATERRGAIGSFDGQIQALEAQPATVERLAAIERLMEQKNAYVAGLALRIARAHGTATDVVVANITQGLEAENRALRVRFGAKEKALQGRIDDRTRRQTLQGQAGALSATRSGIKPGILSDLGRTQLSAEQIEQIAGLETQLSENRYQQNLLQVPAASRGDANDARVQAYNQAREARNAAIEDQRTLRLASLQAKIEANDQKQQGLVERQIGAAITAEERRTRGIRGMTPAQRAAHMGEFIRGQMTQPLRDERGNVVYHDIAGMPGGRPDRAAVSLSSQEGLDRFGAMATEQEQSGQQLEHKRALEQARQRALDLAKQFPGERNKSQASYAVADALEALAYNTSLVWDDNEQQDLLNQAENLRNQADAQAADFSTRRQDYQEQMQGRMAIGAARGTEKRGKGIFGLFGTGVSRENRIQAAELLQSTIGEQRQAREYGVDISPYTAQMKKQVDKLMSPTSLWDKMVDDAKDKFGNIADSFSKAVGEMAAKGGNLKKWWKDLWGEIVSWFTSFVVKSVLMGIGKMFGAKGGGNDPLDSLLGSLRKQAFGGPKGGGAGAGAGGVLGAVGQIGSLFGGGGAGAGAAAASGALPGMAGLPDFAAMSAGQGGGLGPTIGAAAQLAPLLGGAGAGTAPIVAGSGGLGGMLGSFGGMMAQASPYLAAATLLFSLFKGKNPFKHLFGHHRFLGIKFDDPVNDFHAASSGRDFTQLFLSGVSHEMATRTANLVAPAMPGYMASQARSGQATMSRLQPATAGAGGSSMSVQFNNPVMLNRQMVDTLSDHVDRTLANRILGRSRRGVYGGRDRLG